MLQKISKIISLEHLRNSFSESEFVRLQMTMRVCIISISFGLSFAIVLFAVGITDRALICLLQPLSYLVLCILAYYGKFNCVKPLHTFTAAWGIFAFSCYCTLDSGVHLYILLGPIFVLSLYDLKQKLSIGLSILFYIATFYACVVFEKNSIFPSIPTFMFNKDMVLLFYALNNIFIVILSTILVAYILSLNAGLLIEILQKNQVLNSTQKMLSNEIVIRKESEAKVKTMYDELQMSYDRLTHFNQMVSHNLRSPIANLIGLSYLIEDEDVDLDEKILLISNIKTTAEKLDDVIKDMNQILTINKNFDEIRELVDLELTLQKVIEESNTILNSIGAIVNINFSKANSLKTVSSFVHSIFYNLLSNAIKYRRPNDALIVNIESVIENDFIKITFKDNGLGIDMKNNLAKVFKPYTRFHADIEGSGIGLYLVQSQIQMLGGRIALESEVNKGTTFSIWLKI